ncbi:MAG: hypothetical protein ACJ71Z_13220 [Aeromicrobium sp.]
MKTMNPAEEQARRDWQESVRQQRDAEERERARREAHEMEVRRVQEAINNAAMEEARLRAQQAGRPNWHF